MSQSTSRRFALALLMVLALTFGACAPTAPAPAGETTPAPIAVTATGAPDAQPTATPQAEAEAIEEPTAEPQPAPAQSAAGIYKGFFPGASSPGLDTTLYLNADQSLRLVSDYLNEEPPIVEVGTWESTQDGAVTITLTGQEDGHTYETPATFTYTLADDRLDTDEWIGPWFRFDALAMGMEPPYDASTVASLESDGFTGFYRTFLPAATCCGRDVTLLLAVDDRVRLTTDYLNGEPPIVQVGTWEPGGDNTVTVTLTGQEGGSAYAEPETLVLALQDDRLVAVEYDQAAYGDLGLRFYYFPGLALASVER